ncbi:ABC transporter permease [Marinicrinis lubricantis]|uniref:ABC transporter permease n=1 Tax=Marinicrinis lubricantis TaxID=2086470 RepID=A0ABW1IVA0_9BACL
MKFSQGFKMAAASILANKLRSLLTMLGIMIGVGSVIALVGLGQGTTKTVTEQVQGLGSDLITVNVIGRGSSNTLDYETALSISDIEGVEYAAPVNSQNATVKRGTASVTVSVLGTNTDYLVVQNYELASGRFIAPLDLQFNNKVAILGSATAQELFGFADPVGEYVQLNGTRYKVVGVLTEKGDSSSGSNDEVVMIPLTSSERLFQSVGVRTVYASAESEEMMDLAKAGIESALSEAFRGNTDSYTVMNQEDLLETVTSVSDTLALAMGGIAGISLLVGGIGIMNIMLVSVTERTREIGIRKAIGAKKVDILVQFLIEAILLSGLGGVIGIGLGIGAGNIASSSLGMDVVYSLNVMLVAFGFSVVVGIIFGLFPANKAASLKPIDALRSE